MITFEHRSKPVLSRRAFFRRLARSFLTGGGLVGISLAAGMAGYHFLENLSWLDSFVNAAMILSGMGPLASPQTTGGKLFAGCFALYSGLIVIFVAGVIFAPVVHRFMHKFHAETQASGNQDDEGEEGGKRAGDARTATRGSRQTKRTARQPIARRQRKLR